MSPYEWNGANPAIEPLKRDVFAVWDFMAS
jgi:hypothetical protein